jgi:hypothetical protein
MLRFLLPAAALLSAAPANAASTQQSWDLVAGGTVVFHIDLRRSGQAWQATWRRPGHFETDGDSFFELAGPAITRKAQTVREVEGDLELTFADPAPGASPDVLRIHPLAGGQASMSYVGFRLAPFPLTRSTPAMPVGPWDSEAHYPLVAHRPTNAAMTALFDADQADRKQAHIDWSILSPADMKRRQETQALLDAGALQSGADFFHAAFVFQHGQVPEDFLKAHLLAMVAVARGRSDALWIASASLDRYLQNIKQPQVLGTQFAIIEGKAVQEPFNPTLISDAMRQALGVPPLAEQAAQGRMFEERDARSRAKP